MNAPEPSESEEQAMCSHCDGHPDEQEFVREFNERRQAINKAESNEPLEEMDRRISGSFAEGQAALARAMNRLTELAKPHLGEVS